MTSGDEKIMVVQDFMLKAFPGARLSVKQDIASRSQVFSAQLKDSTYTVVVREDFLQKHEAVAIPGKLESFLLIEHLQDTQGVTFVVTPNGLEL